MKASVFSLLVISVVGLLQPQPMRSQSLRPNQPTAPKSHVLCYQGSWTGTLQYVGFQGQMLLYIDPAGRSSGSFLENEGNRFAQISGYHSGNMFYVVFTPPLGSNYMSEGTEPYTINAIAKIDGVNRFEFGVPGHTGHPQSYTFERKVNSDK